MIIPEKDGTIETVPSGFRNNDYTFNKTLENNGRFRNLEKYTKLFSTNFENKSRFRNLSFILEVMDDFVF